MNSIEQLFKDANISWWNPANEIDKRFWFFNKQLAFIGSSLKRLKEVGFAITLDAGSGRGVHSKLLKLLEYRTVVSLDINAEMLRTTKNYADTPCIQASLLKLPFANESFDVILSIGTSMHIPYAEIMLNEIHRALKSGGIAIISASNMFSLYTVWATRLNPILTKHQQLYHRRQFSYWYFKKLLRHAGFTILDSRGFGVIPPLSLLPKWKVPIIPLFISRGLSALLDPFFAKRFGCALTFILVK